MKEEKTTPLRQRMIEDMKIRGLCEKTQQGHIRGVKHFAAFLGRSPDTATPDDLRSYQLQMTKDGVSATTFNVRIISLRFFFSVTCGREEMKRYMQFHRQPRKLPVVLSVEEVAKLLASVPGPGLKYRAALGISYGAGLRASEVCNLKVRDIVPTARLRHDDSQRMLIHVEEAQREQGPASHVVAQPAGGAAAILARVPARRLAVSGQTEDFASVVQAVEPCLHGGQRHGGDHEARDPAHPAPQLCHASARGQYRCAGDPGSAGSRPKLSTTARYAHVATKTIQSTVSPFEQMKLVQC